ncbi:PAS domain-containing protein [Chloroflexota bacterium]
MVSDNEKTREQLLSELAAMDSARRQAESLQKETSERLEAIFDLSPDAYYLSDLKGTFIDGNKAAEELIGYSKKELVGKSFLKLDLLSMKQVPKATELLARNAMGKATGPDEFLLKRKDGSRVEVEISTIPLKIEKKAVVLGVVRDISERRRIEQELQECEEQLSLVSESVNDAIIRLDDTGTIIAANSRIEDIFGYKPGEVTGKNFTKLGLFGANDLPKIIQLFGGVLKGDTPQLMELEPKRKDGARIRIEARTKVIKKQNNIEGILVIVRDIGGRG